MLDGHPIRVPFDYVNDDCVKFLRWLVQDGQEVREGDALAEVETSKALVELAASATGRVWQRTKPGEEVRVGELVGYISKNGSRPPDLDTHSVPSAKHDSYGANERLPSHTRFSRKALELLQGTSLSPELFTGRGMVREQDVLAAIEGTKSSRRAQLSGSNTDSALEGISLDRLTLPSSIYELDRGKIDREFLERLQKDSDSFARLSSREKCEIYRGHGASVGDGVVLGDGTVLIAPQIIIGERAQFGERCSIHCRERFDMGQLSSFRSGLLVRGGTVVLGENVFGGRNVQVGGGGNGDPFSLLSVGDGTYLGDEVFVNICRPVLIGKEVFLTQRSILVTHNIGHSILEGYENRFAPIVLEDYSQVGMNCTVYAGSRVGRGSIVMSNSYVISPIPEGKLAAGVPARVIREAKRPMDRERQVETVQGMMREYHELLLRKGYEVSALKTEPLFSFEAHCGEKCFLLSFVETYCNPVLSTQPMDESIIWTFQNSCDGTQNVTAIMDLLAKKLVGSCGIFGESTREFLRKRGIRLQPGPWRYQGGVI